MTFELASQSASENSTVDVCVELTDIQGGLRRAVPFTITGMQSIFTRMALVGEAY